MKSKLIVGGALAVSAIAWAAKDPVIMTVNGVSVPRSEFEYLYRKNTQQQIEPQPLDTYAEMFAVYKMKVAAAKAAGLDTSAAFNKEMGQYARELATPYLTDTVYINKLVDTELKRMKSEAQANHIMIYKSTPRARQLADSIRGVLLKGGDFATLAAEYSADRGSSQNGGSMGYITAGRFPYDFETAVFETPEGKLAEVVESDAGYHIVKGGKKIPARGFLNAGHIMKSVAPNASAQEQAAAKAQIDSIYAVIQADPSKFEELARQLSDDKASGQRGGMLPPFQSGQMIPEFNEAAFALADGEISAPLKSMYGWHIIKRVEQTPAPSEAQLRPRVRESFSNPMNDRSRLVYKHMNGVLSKKLHGNINDKVVAAIAKDANELGTDSLFLAKYSEGPNAALPIFGINKQVYTLSSVLPKIQRFHYPAGAGGGNKITEIIDDAYAQALREQALVQLEKDEPDFRNLLNEYRDGSLLYEISLREVWDKAAKDTEGLEKYFNDHRSDFTWTEPHVKGYLVQAANDSVASAIQTRLAQLPAEEIVKTIRSEFKGQAAIDKILMQQGQNPMVDNLVFGGEAVTPSSSAYTTYFIYDQKVLDAPEEVNDVRVLVTNAYQNQLESEWIETLKTKYPVVINEKELKKIK